LRNFLRVPSAEYAGLNERMPGNDQRRQQAMSATAIVTDVQSVTKSPVASIVPDATNVTPDGVQSTTGSGRRTTRKHSSSFDDEADSQAGKGRKKAQKSQK